MASTNGSIQAEKLWEHPNPKSSKLYDFLQKVNKKYNKNFSTYNELYLWSITDVAASWQEIWDYVGIRTSQPYTKVISDEKTMYPRPSWFSGAKLNFAENLLHPIPEVDENSLAVIAATETTRREKWFVGSAALDMAAVMRTAGETWAGLREMDSSDAEGGFSYGAPSIDGSTGTTVDHE